MTNASLKTPETPMSLVEAAQLEFLDARKLRLSKHGVTLRLTIEDVCSYLTVSIVRAFPLSQPVRVFSFRDGHNKEIGLLMDPNGMDGESRALLERELDRRYLVPIVKRIRTARERFGTVDWQMDTDRGPCAFTTRNLGENVQRPSAGRIILNDVDGNRYDIRSIDQLDSTSQHLLFRHI